jgi:hypothetical protein
VSEQHKDEEKHDEVFFALAEKDDALVGILKRFSGARSLAQISSGNTKTVSSSVEHLVGSIFEIARSAQDALVAIVALCKKVIGGGVGEVGDAQALGAVHAAVGVHVVVGALGVTLQWGGVREGGACASVRVRQSREKW